MLYPLTRNQLWTWQCVQTKNDSFEFKVISDFSFFVPGSGKCKIMNSSFKEINIQTMRSFIGSLPILSSYGRFNNILATHLCSLNPASCIFSHSGGKEPRSTLSPLCPWNTSFLLVMIIWYVILTSFTHSPFHFQKMLYFSSTRTPSKNKFIYNHTYP